jgi:nitrous oxidase accessory protein NosD
MRRTALTFALAIAALLALSGTASAATWHVWPGHSIQRAIRHASPGDTIIVHRGVYHQNLTIRKSHLTLIGRHAVLRQPAHPRGFCAQVSAPEVDGICVLGKVDSSFNPLRPTVGTTIRGFTVKRFHGDGIFMFNVANSRIIGNVAAHNSGYGIAGFVQHGGAYLWNRSHDNGEPGLYLGDSPHADYVIAHNSVYRNQYGVFIRHSAHGRVHNNRSWGNCVGMFLLDDGEQGGLHNMTLWNNRVWANDKACAADDEGAPPLSGIGVLMLGARRTLVTHNWITDNKAGGPSFLSAGLVLLSAKTGGGSGSDPRHDTIAHNTITGNSPLDVFYDKSGSDNHFPGNTCNASQPAWICN